MRPKTTRGRRRDAGRSRSGSTGTRGSGSSRRRSRSSASRAETRSTSPAAPRSRRHLLAYAHGCSWFDHCPRECSRPRRSRRSSLLATFRPTSRGRRSSGSPGYGYLDDMALAGQLARGMRSRGYGRRRAEQKLRERGLGGTCARDALDEAFGEQDEAALAREALGRRPVTDDAERRRALAFLARRGFSAGAAWAAIRRAGEES